MSFDWGDFLEIARRLAADPTSVGPEEAALQTAISRAYYAAFHHARRFAQGRGDVRLTERGEDHSLVIRYFQESRERQREKIGTDLDRLYDHRRKADYKRPLRENLPSKVQASLVIASRILEALGALGS